MVRDTGFHCSLSVWLGVRAKSHVQVVSPLIQTRSVCVIGALPSTMLQIVDLVCSSGFQLL